MKVLITFLGFLLASSCFAQKINWIQGSSSELGFAEDLGRYKTVMNEEIMYYTNYGKYNILFSKDAIIIGSPEFLSDEEMHERKEKLEHGEEVPEIPFNYFKIEFSDANAECEVVPGNLMQHTRNFSFPDAPHVTVKSKAYEYLVYRNIYPLIDLKLELPPEGGLKYSFHVHPGADYKAIRMEYFGVDVSEEEGNLELRNPAFSFTDKMPKSFVMGELVDSKFQVENNTVKFEVEDYDQSKELIIDPWLETVVTSHFTEIAADNAGNCVARRLPYGGVSELWCYDNTGTLQWTLVLYSPEDIAMDPVTGMIYTIAAFGTVDMRMLDLTGTEIAFNPMDGTVEALRLKWSAFHNKIVCGEGDPYGYSDHLSLLPPDLSDYTQYMLLPDETSGMEDCALLEVDPIDGSFYYVASGYWVEDVDSVYGNQLYKMDASDPTLELWHTYTGNGFRELNNSTYLGYANGVNGIAAGIDYVYTYNGNKLLQFDKITGEPLDSLFTGDPEFSQFGLDTDDCGNVYLGTDDSILIFTENLDPLGGFEIPGVNYDLIVVGNKLYASGFWFLTEIDLGDLGVGTATLTSTSAVCDSCNGTATIIPEPCGTHELASIVWEPGGYTSETITGLCPGVYIATTTWLTESGSEIVTVDSVEVSATVEGGISVDLDITNESCSGACDGSIVISPTSGEAPYTYSVDMETNGTGFFDELCNAEYFYTVVDDNGCEVNGSFFIETEGLGLIVSALSEPSCYGFTDGSITVETMGGVGDITYTWIPENPVEGSTFNNLGEGTYVVIAGNEYCSDTLTLTLNQPDSLWATLNIINPLCHGDSSGIAIIDSVYNAQGDLGNISYYWAPNYFGNEGAGVDSAYNMPAGEYTLTINDDKGCSQVLDFTIAQPEELVFSELGSESAWCRLFGYQNGNGVVFASASGGVADYHYDWINLETGDTTDNSTWGGLNPGLYEITITDNNGCQLVETIELDSLNPVADFVIVSDQLDENCEGTEVVIANFINQSINFTNPYDPDTTFLWNLNYPHANWIISHDINDQIDTGYVGEAVYKVCLVALNQNGCADTLCKEIIVHVQPELQAPNIFTPGNGTNDVFTFAYRAEGISEFQCTIINRWGRVVGELNDITDGWDGTDRNGDNCVDGVYYYTYSAVSTNGTSFSGQGHVQLIRN